jgi:hypothetical protein
VAAVDAGWLEIYPSSRPKPSEARRSGGTSSRRFAARC